MRIMISKPKAGKTDIMAVPPRGKGLSPILVKGVAIDDLAQPVNEVLEEIRRATPYQPEALSGT